MFYLLYLPGVAAKIADVGLARFMHADQVTQMTAMGTMAWAAPEVLRYVSIHLLRL